MIGINNISVSFSGHQLFEDISFKILPKDRIGLTGKNGVGKSTLLKVIMNIQEPDSGSVALSEDDTLGYLPQELEVSSQKSIMAETLSVFEEVHSLEREIEEINKALEDRTDYESESYSDLIQKLSEKHERLHLLDPGKVESEAERVLKGLGFKPSEFQKSVSELSGGWQMRIELAKLLIKRPTLLLLDEPTNHLDIEAILWLEQFLKNYSGSILMISHDRMFLDSVTNRTIEIVAGRIYDYNVPYSKYVIQREERLEQQLNAKRNQDKFIEQQERFIERFRAQANKAKQVQSKIKQLEKLDEIETDQFDTASIQFNFPPAPHSGKIAMKGKDIGKEYENKTVFKGLDFELERGDRVAFVGQNGQGKSTLVKIIAEGLEHEGELELGHKVKIGYYAQIQEGQLDPEKKVFDTIDDEATGDWRNVTHIRSLLGAFLFGDADMDKRVKVLSGGEKSRLALAKLLLHPSNLLILDEPTNHLDMDSKAVLKQALQDFDGTLILVSHDRDFLQDLTNKTFEFKDQKIKEHLGDIKEFLDHHQVEDFRGFEQGGSDQKQKEKKQKKATPKKKQKESHEERKEREKEIRKLKKAVNNKEKKVSQTEEKIAELEEKMNAPDFYDQEHSKDTFFEHGELTKKLEQYMHEWETLQNELDEMEAVNQD
jgi:ATP-binding cassette subfamily F protein 3